MTDKGDSFNILEKAIEMNWHIKALQLILVIAAAFVVYRFLVWLVHSHENRLSRKGQRDNMSRTYSRLAVSLIRYIIMLAVFLYILQMAGVNVGSLIAGLGLVSIIVGLAIQDWLKDIIRGAGILSDSYFRVGNIVRYKDREGEVLAIGLKTTKIRLLDSDNILSVANRNIEEIEVVSRVFREAVPMPYDLTVAQAEAVVEDIAARVSKNDHVESCRYVGVTELASSAILYYLEIRSDPLYRRQVRRDTLRSILLGMEAHHVAVPFEQLDVHMD